MGADSCSIIMRAVLVAPIFVELLLVSFLSGPVIEGEV
jgi:hypothetical protein